MVKGKRIGVDVDGVLARFDTKFIDTFCKITNKDLFPPRPFDPPCWNYPELYGYSNTECAAVWDHIKKSYFFWQTLPDYPETKEALWQLYGRILAGDDVYFITTRPSSGTATAKAQTERWLQARVGANFNPTVLVTGEKGDACNILDIDVYIDDKWENCTDVACAEDENAKNIGVTVYMVDRPWNRDYQHLAPTYGIKVVKTILDMMKEI